MSANSYSQLSDVELRAALLQRGFDIPVSVNRELLVRKLQNADAEAKKNGRKSTGGVHLQPLAAATAASVQRARHSMGPTPTATAPAAAGLPPRRTTPALVQEEESESEEEEEEEQVQVHTRPPPAAATAQPTDPRRSQRYSNYLNLFRQTPVAAEPLPHQRYNSRQFSDDEDDDEDTANSRTGLRSYLNPFNWKRRSSGGAGSRAPATAGGTPTAASRLSKYITTTSRQQQQNGQSRRGNAPSESGWDTPKLLLLLGAVFFCLIAGGYYYKGQQQQQQSEKGLIGTWPICGLPEVDEQHCVPNSAVGPARELFTLLKEELQRRASWAHCGADVDEKLSLEDARTLLYRLSDLSKATVDSVFPSLLKLAVENGMRWGVFVENGEGAQRNSYKQVAGLDLSTARIYAPVPPSLFCKVWVLASATVNYSIWIGGACLLVYALVFVYLRWRLSKKLAEEQLYAMVQQILDLLRTHYEETKDSPTAQPFLAISHIRDSLIPLQERAAKAALWLRVQEYISSNESRVREEVQHIDGEEFVIWRWLPAAGSPVLRRSEASSTGSPDGSNSIWQGQAFEMDEGSPNSLPATAPTCCLKIRHMYDAGKGTATFSKIEAAILEKCASARVLHIGIDPHSQDGAVYVKCATREDARKAYMQIHGWWYDGHLLSVKFLREERYATRFPEVMAQQRPAAFVG